MGKFASLFGFSTIGKLATWLKTNKDDKALQQSIVDTGIDDISTAYKAVEICNRRSRKVIDVLEYLVCMRKLSPVDFQEYQQNGVRDLSLSNREVLEEIVTGSSAQDINFDQVEAGYVLQHFSGKLSYSLLEKFLFTERQIRGLSEGVFAHVATITIAALEDSYANIDTDNARNILKRCVFDGISTSEDIAKAISPRDSSWSRDKSIRQQLKIDSFTEKVTAVKAWLGDTAAIEDKVCMDFYKAHCVPAAMRIKEPDGDYFGFSPPRGETLPDIEKVLKSKSDLAPPVLASYLLYNLASTGFSTERFYAILYIIGRLEILHPLIKQIEPVIRIDEINSYNTDDINSELAANFLLMNKVSLIERDPKGYTEFVENLYYAGHYSLVIGESMRMLEFIKLGHRHSLINEFVVKAVDNSSLEELKKMGEKTLSSACIILELAGHDTSKLQPFIRKDRYAVFSQLRFSKFTQYFSQYQEHEYRKISAELFHIRSIYDAERAVSANKMMIDIMLTNGLKIVDTNFDMNFSANHAISKSVRLYNGGGRSGCNLMSSFPKRLEVLVLALSGVNSRDISVHDFTVSLFLYDNKIATKKDLVTVGRSKYIYIDNALFVLEESSIEDNKEALLKYKPHTIHFLRSPSIHGGIDKWGSDVSGIMGSLQQKSVTGLKPAFYDDYLSSKELLSDINIGQYFGHNPFMSIVEKMLPQFHYANELMNPNGKDYVNH